MVDKQIKVDGWYVVYMKNKYSKTLKGPRTLKNSMTCVHLMENELAASMNNKNKALGNKAMIFPVSLYP